LGTKKTPSKYPAPPETTEVPASSEKSSAPAGETPENPGKSGEASNLAGETPENPGKSGETPSQFNLIESNLRESNGEEEPSSPTNVIPFPPSTTRNADGTSQEREDQQQQRITQTTAQVAEILKLPVTASLARLVAEF